MTENLLQTMTGDTSTSQQYLDTFRRSEPWQSERALLVALLDDAIHDYRKFSRARDRERQDRFRQAAEWIMADEDDWIFSFKNICELLGLDPEYVRRRLREAKGGGAVEQKPRQPHGNRRRAA